MKNHIKWNLWRDNGSIVLWQPLNHSMCIDNIEWIKRVLFELPSSSFFRRVCRHNLIGSALLFVDYLWLFVWFVFVINAFCYCFFYSFHSMCLFCVCLFEKKKIFKSFVCCDNFLLYDNKTSSHVLWIINRQWSDVFGVDVHGPWTYICNSWKNSKISFFHWGENEFETIDWKLI